MEPQPTPNVPGRKPRSDRPILVRVVLFLTGAIFVYALLRWARGPDLQQLVSDRVALTFLMLGIGILVLTLAFVLLRNLVKLLVERRRDVLGSRFRTKLVVSFLILCLIPSVALFYAAVTAIGQTVEDLFTPAVEDLAGLSQDVVYATNDARESDALWFSREMAREVTGRRLLDSVDRPGLELHARFWLSSYKLDLVAIFLADGKPAVLVEGGPPGGPGRLSRRALAEILKVPIRKAIGAGEEASRIDRLDRGQLVSGIAPIRAGIDGRDIGGAVVGGYYLNEEIAAKTTRIAGINQEYRQLKAYRREIKRVYTGFFLLLTLLTLFSAVWLGMYLARQITVPIQKLAEGTREIASGNLDFRVEAEAGDEIGDLIRSFNNMTADIQRKEGQLEERRLYIETLLENVSAGVVSLDREGRVTACNGEVYRLLGLDPARDIRGMQGAEAFSAPALRPLLDLLRDSAGAEGIRATRELTIAAGGRTINLAAIVSNFLGPHGRSSGVLVVLQDLTLLIRAQKSAAWREAARRIAHEIKNPLTPIQLSAERILKKFRESSPDLGRVLEEGAAAIIAEVSSLKAMVDEFSRFARVPAVSPAPNDLKGIVESALSLYVGTHPGIRFDRDLDPTPARALLDPEQMKRVLINLIDNSIQAMGGEGTITIGTRHIPERGVFRIQVADDGPGIPEEDRDKLFLPYVSTKHRGTGLGLAIVNRIISDHAGTIRVEQNTPRGAAFVIEIPAAGGDNAG